MSKRDVGISFIKIIRYYLLQRSSEDKISSEDFVAYSIST